jgi:hypothetical protein
MLKLIETNSFGWYEPDVSILDLAKVGELTKVATHKEISEYAKDIIPEPGKVYIHVLALSAMEATGYNRNSDGFPRDNLKKYYKTFESGHIFTHHQNKRPETAIGKIIKAVYNDRMDRVELIAWVDKVKGREFTDLIESDKFPSMSMAVRTGHDTCSICGNQAKTRQQYCTHLNNELGRMYGDGRKVGAINDAPLNFFEQSWVYRGADPLSSVLQKLASTYTPVISSAELAEIEGLTEKAASHKKLSELIKEIEGNVIDYDTSLEPLLAKVSDPLDSSIPALAQHELVDVFATLAHLGITPSLRFLADLIGHKIAGPDAQGIGALVEGYVGAQGIKELVLGDKGFDDSAVPNRHIIDILSPSVKQASLMPDAVIERALGSEVVHSNYGYSVPGTNVGYVGNGPFVEETPVDRFNRLVGHPDSAKTHGIIGMLKSLIVIGGAALAAKWYITNMIERRVNEELANSNHGAKIALVKRASDFRSTHRLAMGSMMKTLKQV